MKIESMGSPKASGIKNKNNTAKTGNAGFTAAISKETMQSGDIVQLSSTQSISSLWALQEVDQSFEKRKKAIRKGHIILEELSNLQKSISLGNDPKQILSGMQALLMNRDDAGDPNLQDVLDAIYLRASVEAAKFSK